MESKTREKGFLSDLDPVVTFSVIGIYIFCIGFIAIDAETFNHFFKGIRNWLIFNINWGFQLFNLIVIFLALGIAISKWGGIKLGRPEDQPEYSNLAWLAMLFSSGFGLTMWLLSTTEIIWHWYGSDFIIDAGFKGDPRGVSMAMQSVLMDNGIHGWVLFSMGGLALALPAFRLGKPMNLGVGLYGILGERSYNSGWSKITDILGAIAGIGANVGAIGLGSMTLVTGLKMIFGLELGTAGRFLIVVMLTIGFVLSAASGIDKGIKNISLINIWLSFGITVFIIIVGPTNYIMNTMVESLGKYMSYFFEFSLWADVGTFKDGAYAPRGWQNWWLVFYILWWIAMVPFVGGFFARISKGRTVREYLFGTIIMPSLLILFFWGAWGSLSAHAQITGLFDVYKMVQDNMGGVVFELLKYLPLTALTMFVVFCSSTMYGITTYDSATYYISMQFAKGDLTPRTSIRVALGTFVGVVALIFLIIGDFEGVKTLFIVCGAPFTFVMVGYIISVFKMLKKASNGEM